MRGFLSIFLKHKTVGEILRKVFVFNRLKGIMKIENGLIAVVEP